MRDTMRSTAHSTKRVATKRVAARKMDTTSQLNITTTTARRDQRRRDLITRTMLDTRKSPDTTSITTIIKTPARREDLTITRNGDTRRAREDITKALLHGGLLMHNLLLKYHKRLFYAFCKIMFEEYAIKKKYFEWNFMTKNLTTIFFYLLRFLLQVHFPGLCWCTIVKLLW